MKKLIAIFTSVLLLCAMLPLSAVGVSAATSGTTGDCTWTLNGTHLTISGNGKMGDYSFQYIDGANRSSAPWGWNITSVTIEDGVTTIGERAFYNCDSLTEVTIGDSVTTIGSCAFFNCDSLTEVTIGDSVTTIGERAFYYCTSLTSVTIGDSVTTIGEKAFFSCASLTSVTIPDSVTTIGDSAFGGCDSLTSVTIPDSVTSIGRYAFGDCDNLTSVTIPDSVTTIGDSAFAGCSSLTSVTIPDSVTSIGGGAFDGCSSLTSVTIPDSVTSIGIRAFADCSSLTSVTIGDSVTTIEGAAFYNCTSLTDVYYTGSRTDRAAMRIDASGNEKLLNATWHYNCINPKDLYSADVQHSVMETENGNGLAFRFELSANGVAVKNRIEADLTNATVNYLGKDCKLLGMGAVMANDAAIGATAFTLDDVNNSTVLNIPAVYLCDLEPDSCAFAVRIINIPDIALERTIYARPYYVVEVDGEEIVVYGDVDTASCAEYM